jgi:hypothetical protein
VGKGPKGGYSYFGHDAEKAEGYVIHRFWPRYHATGTLVVKGQAIPVNGPGMFVHAIQGMRPNLVASRWNFAHFQSDEHDGVSAVQMDFTTLDTHGKKGAGSGGVTVSVGGLVLGGKLAAVTTETKWPGETQPEAADVMSRATHMRVIKDPDTGYEQPTEIVYKWTAPSIVPDAPGAVDASLHVSVGGPGVAEAKGLVEKVDVLGEIPYALKMAVNYVAGTKPYIYQASSDHTSDTVRHVRRADYQGAVAAFPVAQCGDAIGERPGFPRPWLIFGIGGARAALQRGDVHLVDTDVMHPIASHRASVSASMCYVAYDEHQLCAASTPLWARRAA